MKMANVTTDNKHKAETDLQETLISLEPSDKQFTTTAEPTNDPTVLNYESWFHRHHGKLAVVVKSCILVAYIAYFTFAIRYSQKTKWTEDSWRLIWVTCMIAFISLHKVLLKTSVYKILIEKLKNGINWVISGKTGQIIRIFLYVALSVFMVVYTTFVATKRPGNLQSLFGLIGFPVLLFLYSNNRRKIQWDTVFSGIVVQFIISLIIMKTVWGAQIIQWIADRLMDFLKLGHTGSTFLFGSSYKDHVLAFGTTIQGMALLVGISVLTYLGIIETLVNTVGILLAFCMHVSPPEGINAVSSIFLQVPGSLMFVQRYLTEMTPSKLFTTYAVALATVGGAGLVIFVSFGIEAAPLVAASAMSAPAALVACKIVFPSHEAEKVPNQADILVMGKVNPLLRRAESLTDSVMLGIQQSVQLIVNAMAFICTFIMILAFTDRTLTWFGDRVGIDNLTLELILSYVFYPAAFMLGAPAKDCSIIGEVLGIRTASLAIVAFPKFAPIVKNSRVFRQYVSENVNNTWISSGRDVILVNSNVTLVGGVVEKRSEIIATYALCGSASISMIGYILGIFSVMIPSRTQEVSQHMLRAMLTGTVACYMTACFAGLMYEDMDVQD